MDNVTNQIDCCVFCLMPKKNEVILMCKHSFCFDCMDEYCKVVRCYRRCPICREEFTYYETINKKPSLVVLVDDDIFEPEDDDSSDEEYLSGDLVGGPEEEDPIVCDTVMFTIDIENDD